MNRLFLFFYRHRHFFFARCCYMFLRSVGAQAFLLPDNGVALPR